MKTLIAIPCMSSVPTKFLRSLEYLKRQPDTYTSISEHTLIHDARNEFTSLAITSGFDRILWLDSDMTFDPDLMLRLSADMDTHHLDVVTGIYFKRVMPTEPVIYKDMMPIDQNGKAIADRTQLPPDHLLKPIAYTDYPRDQLFRIAACGFGCVMTSVPVLRKIWDTYGPPFSYYRNVGEDMSFCIRAQHLGTQIWCDSSIKCGHVGYHTFNEQTYLSQAEPADNHNPSFRSEGCDPLTSPATSEPR